MRFHLICASLVASASLLAACSVVREPASSPSTARQPAGATSAPGAPQSQPGTATPEVSPAPGQPSRPPPKQFKLGPAASSLVAQAHKQAGSGAFAPAAVTIERALRIEPENPLLWIELGRVRLSENNAAQADGLGRKALALATGDPQAQASAWRLIAESLRARGRNPEAAEAEKRAGTLAAR